MGNRKQGDRAVSLRRSRFQVLICGMMLGDDGQDGLVKQPVAGQDARLGDRQRLAATGCHLAARLLDEEAAGGEVPGGKLVLEEGAEGSQADIRQVERGGPHAADAVDVAVQQVADGVQGRLHHRAAVVIVAEADQDLVEPVVLGDPDRLAIVIGPLSAGRDEPVVAGRDCPSRRRRARP